MILLRCLIQKDELILTYPVTQHQLNPNSVYTTVASKIANIARQGKHEWRVFLGEIRSLVHQVPKSPSVGGRPTQLDALRVS